MCINY